ncbi:DNA damage-induced apoptosis suppressor protein [Xenopus laevis]|uniref:DNA damage-induced apoptosis suppressor protein n=1 Tax=Xenopus laevis TaxID=8355 RepID=A0A8J0UG26_XENLA|nr:DNA damage-induced apoptosis suppressor protein [Xenopus laevis]XP_018103337.1 DNA damage-induced apoptosis suppressor protein [Xenopus laevis]XP_018103338.1 DNA damage-induced apoptosis suppressor protein [Xenopus laevis]XP_018103339.1 DNA damage-induced apoptosis suppressor protein [Xenopus laevis]XP_041438794.1 DNA damage-induced apoptosis suppressor protein [Xenopus laevis]
MNGNRRFLRASVLSILGSSCTYPACQHCFTRLIRAANRFQCPRCGSGSKEAKQRYKLCLKVAEWSQLYIVTVFGSCLDKIFGTSASSLQRHLQGSIETRSNLASDGAQELLNQAVEQFFVGRNFLFGVKIPEGRAEVTSPGRVSLYNSRRHIIAAQIFPPDDGAFGFTVLDCYSRLLSSALNGLQPESGTFSPDHLKKDLSNSGSIFSPSVNNADLWQQSFALTSLNASQGSLSRESIDKDGHFNCPSQDFLCTNKHLDNTNAVSVTAPSIVSRAAAFTNKSPRPSFDNSSVVSENGRKVSGFVDCVLTSDPGDKELHKSWHSACGLSPISPPCAAAAAAAASKNTKAAGIHQEGPGIWDDSIYSESFSEFSS